MAFRDVPEPEFKTGGFVKLNVGEKFGGWYVSNAPGTYGEDFVFRCKDGTDKTFTAKGPVKKQLIAARLSVGDMVLITRRADVYGKSGEGPFWSFGVQMDDSETAKKAMPKAKDNAPEPGSDFDIPF